jgi:hypothetical protein
MNGFKPRVLPIEQAPRLTSIMSLAVTARFEMNGVFEPARVVWEWCAVIAGFVRAFLYPKTPAAILQHLGHKWHRLKTAFTVECAEDFFLRSNFDPFAYTVFKIALHVILEFRILIHHFGDFLRIAVSKPCRSIQPRRHAAWLPRPSPERRVHSGHRRVRQNG